MKRSTPFARAGMMNAVSRERFRFILGLRDLLSLLVLLAASSRGLAGQDIRSHTVADSVIQSHFAAAQAAQRSQNYAAAEREYRAVLALAPDFAEVHMNLGLLYQLQDRGTEAMTEFRRALKIKPGLAGANFFLGVDYCKIGDGAKAIPYLRAAVREEPNRPDIWSWLATALEMSGDIQAEIVTINRGLELQPRDVDLLYLLGHAYERLGKEEVAGLEKKAPGSSRAEQLLAESYAMSSEWPSAVIHFQNALTASPSRSGLHVELGEVLLRAGKLNRAVQEFDNELHLDPNSLRALVRRGEARMLEGDLDGSLRDWSQAIAIDEPQAEGVLGIREMGFGDSAFELLPDASRAQIEQLAPDLQARNTPAAHFALAFLAAQDGNAAQASAEATRIAAHSNNGSSPSVCSQDEVRHALEQGRFSGIAACVLRILNEQSPVELRIQAAAALLQVGDYDASLEILAGLPLRDRHSPEASYWRARCYERLATAAYLRLYQADRNSYRVRQLIGDLDAARGEDVAAIAEYRAAIDLKPSLPNLHYSLGHLLWKNSKVNEARVELQAELTLNPGHAGALNDLGQTYLLEHHPEEALSYLNRAFAQGIKSSDIHRDLGTAYFDLGDYKKADAEFNLALSTDHDGSIHFKLARVYKALGEKDKAAHEFALSAALNRESHSKLEKQTERLIEIEK
jgi:tetratricopeptide (TPR) repeat protein